MPDFWKSQGFFYEVNENQYYSGAPLHYHSQLEIYYLKEGTCRYFIDNATYALQAGDVVIIPAGVLHTAVYPRERHLRYLINCDATYIPPSVQPLIPEMTYICRLPEICREVEGLFGRIATEYASPDAFSTEAVRGWTAALLILLARARAERRTVETNAADDFVSAAVSYMQHRYDEPMTMADVAKHCAVSYAHLSRMFKKSTGFGFSEYLTLFRLKQAETWLLEEPATPVGEIAFRCGFGDSNYFATRFKKIYGLTPTELRRQGRSAAPAKVFLNGRHPFI